MMGLFSFFNKSEKTGKDATVNSEELVEQTESGGEDREVETALSFHPDWNVPKEQEYVFRFLSNELEPLKPNQISLSGIDIDLDQSEGLMVKAFFRSSLSKPIEMGNAELMLLDAADNLIASKEFNLKELGEIPAESARPWVFTFEKPYLKVEGKPADGWKLAFNVQSLVPHQLDLDPAWEEGLPEEQKDALRKVIDKLPKLNPREVNFSGFQAKIQPEGNLAVSLFIRNGHTQHITIEQLPLEVLDATGTLVARGSFNLPSLTVKANTSKPWTFIFPKEMIIMENPDFSRWTVRVPQ